MVFNRRSFIPVSCKRGLKLYLGEFAVVYGKSEQSGHYDGFALYNTAASAATWLSLATKKLSAICLSHF